MHITCPTLEKLPCITHGFFTRHGGVSGGLYASLNCSYGTGDNPAHVDENFRRAGEALRVTAIAKPYQVHGTHVVIATQGFMRENAPQADAVVTNTPGIAIGVTTADCLPILFADEKHRVIAAAHAGWKGAIAGIMENTVEIMCSLGATRECIIASVGPGITQKSYEVGNEFYDRFLAQTPENKIYFLKTTRANHYLFDLQSYARDRLKAAGISQINLLAHDTCFEENDFFSYRRSCLRGEPSYGCQLSAIALTKVYPWQ